MFNNTVRDPTQRKQLQLVQLSSYKWQKSQSRVATLTRLPQASILVCSSLVDLPIS